MSKTVESGDVMDLWIGGKRQPSSPRLAGRLPVTRALATISARNASSSRSEA